MKISIEKKSLEEITKMGILNWPIWECEVSEFPWTYSEKESCYILEGEIDVETEIETVKIVPGDFVIFPKGLNCQWKVSKPVRKHYSFG
jgi:hypothetical protein|tara:strand:+ start:377 stop:643 length:267 start_codon:yes stop_codon:yes gene_type:complete